MPVNFIAFVDSLIYGDFGVAELGPAPLQPPESPAMPGWARRSAVSSRVDRKHPGHDPGNL
jgi:hypothetical protein